MSLRAERYGDWVRRARQLQRDREDENRVPPTFHAIGKTRKKRSRWKPYGEIIDRRIAAQRITRC